MSGLRATVLASRYLGSKGDGAAGAEELADFLGEPSAAMAIRRWYGDRALDRILRHDGSEEGRAEAMARLEETVDRDIAALDRLISAQLDQVLHHDRFRRLEGSWRGLCWLTERVPFGARIKLRLLTARWAELCRDFDRAIEFDQSNLFRKVYEEEFGTPGGEPFGMLCADYEVRHAPGPGSPTDDVSALDGLAGVAAAAFAPTVIAASPALLGLDGWGDIGPASDLADPLRQPDRQRWRRLQERDDTRFLSVLLPRVLARAPWPEDGTRPDGFRYREHAPSAAERVWNTPVYAMAAVAIRAFARSGWPAEIRGAVIAAEAEGGVVEALAEERFSADPPGPVARPPVEVALTDEQERLAVEAGLLPLVGLEGLPEACFAAAPSIHRPPRMTTEAADANQRLSAQFNAILCVSRFAHCVKLMGRDMVGAFRNAEDIQNRLQRWLAGFTNASGAAGTGELGARFPLRGARVEVREKPGKPGVFGCVIQLQPHYQLDEVGAAFRLVTDLQAARAAA